MDGDLTEWSATAKTVVLPDGVGMANNAVTMVSGPKAADVAKRAGLPLFQAVMILETDRGSIPRNEFPEFAINTGSDGDLTRNWIVLNGSKYRIDKLQDGEGTGDAPSLRYDPEQGYLYSLGGGWITNGPARSNSLRIGSWEASPLMPMAVPAAIANKAGVPAIDKIAGINTSIYRNIWANGVPDAAKAFMANISDWNFGVTDPDICCNDGQAPSYMLHTLSQQGGHIPAGTRSGNGAALGSVNLPLYEWLRGYFPS